MSAVAKDYNYPLRLPAADAKAVNEVCKQSHASFNSVVALCVRKALPEVRAALTAEEGRITNVDPMPTKTAKKLYAHDDDDAESIRLFMAAQSTLSAE